jgi:hypothetical protein
VQREPVQREQCSESSAARASAAMDSIKNQYNQQIVYTWYQSQLKKYNLRPTNKCKSINLMGGLKVSQTNHVFKQRDMFYAFDSVRNNTVLIDASIKHNGCINCAKWSYQQDFDVLLTGSDDKTVKLWKYEYGAPMTLLTTIETAHRSNIFNVEVCPTDSNKVVSCAADGAVIVHDITNKFAQTNVLQSESFIHSFIFDCEDSNILYVAEDEGCISVVDLRVKSRVNTLFSNKVAKKAVLQSPILGSSNLFIAETDTFGIFRVDLRVINPSITSVHDAYVASYSPLNFTPSYGTGIPSLSFDACKRVLTVQETPCKVSVSGMAISRDSKTLVVTYQGDSIYSFPVDGYRGENEIGADGIYSGHFNVNTFLKNVQFYGPNDEVSTHLRTQLLTHLLTYSLTYLLTHSLTHLLTYLLTHSLTLFLTHSIS